MGTSAEAAMTDKLGRRSGPRRKYTFQEKRAMVEETRKPGASVPEVAQRHGVNANLLSVWRRLERQGFLIEGGTTKALAPLLPVKVTTPTVLPTERVKAAKPPELEEAWSMEVEFSDGRRLRIRGAVDRLTLRELISALPRDDRTTSRSTSLPRGRRHGHA
jgi:transposase-like protein